MFLVAGERMENRKRNGGKTLVKTTSKALEAAELLLAPPGALEDSQALQTAFRRPV